MKLVPNYIASDAKKHLRFCGIAGQGMRQPTFMLAIEKVAMPQFAQNMSTVPQEYLPVGGR